MHFYSIHVIAEYNLSGSEIICRQIYSGIAEHDEVFEVDVGNDLEKTWVVFGSVNHLKKIKKKMILHPPESL